MALPPSLIPSLIRGEDVIIYNTVAASALVFWDSIITFREEEVDLIWRAKWNFVGVLFVVIRYTTLSIRVFQLLIFANLFGVLHPTESLCGAWVWYEAIPGHVVYGAVEAVLMMRVVAFYGRTKVVMASLLGLFIASHAASLTILIISIPKFTILVNPLPPSLHIPACLVVASPPIFVNYWIPGLVFESILFVLLITRFVQTNQWRASRPHVLVIFARDGAWAFALIFGVLIWAALAFQLTPKKGDTALTWILSTLGICGSRLILNLRAAAKAGIGLPSSSEQVEMQSLKQNTAVTSGFEEAFLHRLSGNTYSEVYV